MFIILISSGSVVDTFKCLAIALYIAEHKTDKEETVSERIIFLKGLTNLSCQKL